MTTNDADTVRVSLTDDDLKTLAAFAGGVVLSGRKMCAAEEIDPRTLLSALLAAYLLVYDVSDACDCARCVDERHRLAKAVHHGVKGRVANGGRMN